MLSKNTFWINASFYWVISLICSISAYYILWLIMPNHYVFGTLYRMFLYHWEHPIQYISIICFSFGIIATIFTLKTKAQHQWKHTLVIALLTIIISSPIGGILWHLHDMQAGFFPNFWIEKLQGGISEGLLLGWLIILLSFPYNIIGIIASHYIIKYRLRLLEKQLKVTNG